MQVNRRLGQRDSTVLPHQAAGTADLSPPFGQKPPDGGRHDSDGDGYFIEPGADYYCHQEKSVASPLEIEATR